jgi:anti-anti-sigma regulatory factor
MVIAQRDRTPPISASTIAVARSAGTVVVTIRGHIDAQASQHLGSILADLIDGQGNMSVLVDLREAGATDPDCLWMLTEAAERAHRRGGTVRVDAQPSVLQLRGLDAFVGGAPAPPATLP